MSGTDPSDAPSDATASGDGVSRLLDRCLATPPDDGAWERLEWRCRRPLRAAARRALAAAGHPVTPDRIDDLVQEVWYRVLADGARALAGLRHRTLPRLLSWLGRIAERLAIDAARSEHALKRGAGHLLPLPDEGHPALAADPAVACPDHRARRRETWRRWSHSCRRVGRSRRERRLLSLALLSGWTSREIALHEERTGRRPLSPSTVDSIVHRARRRHTGSDSADSRCAGALPGRHVGR